MSGSTVKVAGRAIVRGEPDEVEFQLSMSYLAPSPEAALAEVARRSNEVEGLFESLDIERKAWSTTGVSVVSEREYIKDRYVDRGYRATNTVTLRLEDASLAGKLIKEATVLAHTKVDGPWWRIALDNPARTEACRQAAREARRKAEAYAEALGTRLGSVLKVVEPELDYQEERHGRVQAYAMSSPMESEDFTIQAGELDISAEVVVTFSLENSL